MNNSLTQSARKLRLSGLIGSLELRFLCQLHFRPAPGYSMDRRQRGLRA